ncbi:Peptidase S8/S53, subtilisin/kexin/sedolisin [Cordyceps fumosorosea ARSEF 2679]|uniref:Peptidase S8/S53, subtilisin/kexin/sedolisin n=1 Tax=Cordyceps fumosorosea (strain ARSEF 2679) TaxID=1081104 RepID=A0A167N5V9_CORFA|nr:Peptidase S8/S53, subtilisin/kexin/sedolisin [Cordyceps fumosorosea ARSEF 2679]OAA55163.1 Peptidase S8/S53, subtilisin/kexin/sedolisin [Cordyceps fumosorosea ARSEF 2679]
MDPEDSLDLWRTVVGHLAKERTGKTASPPSLRAQRYSAWMRSHAYLLHEALEEDGLTSSEDIDKGLGALENVFQHDSDDDSDPILRNAVPFPKLQRIRNMIKQPNRENQSDVSSTIRISKRPRENEAVIQEFSRLEKNAKRRRDMTREEPTAVDDIEEPEVDCAILLRRYSESLHQGLRTQWACVCQKCSGLSVGLALPPRKTSCGEGTSFKMFFCVRSFSENALKEAKITVKAVQGKTGKSTSEFANICKSITESLSQSNCLHLLYDGNRFETLRPEPRSFGGYQIPQAVSLSVFFQRQQELRGGSSVLPLQAKRILALILAKALLPFLETPWVQPSFSHSNILFFQPLQYGELPSITKPFLNMEHVALISGNAVGDSGAPADPSISRHMVHPNASVLALGILLCELHYCTPVGLLKNNGMGMGTEDVNASYYASIEILKNLEDDAGVDYYLATKACLQWEYFPAGEQTSFESISVQKLFYQNVIKRLESVLFKLWPLKSQDLSCLDAYENQKCWGEIGRDVLRQQTSNFGSSAKSDQDKAASSPPMSLHFTPPNPVVQMPAQYPSSIPTTTPIARSSTERLYLFDASHQKSSDDDADLADRWMDDLISSLHPHVDAFDAAARPLDTSTKNASDAPKPVKIAILDSGFDPQNPLLRADGHQLDPRIKDARNFVQGRGPFDYQDEIGHGSHTLGTMLKIATCAEIYVAKIASSEAIHHAVKEWDVDIISMSFGIREYNGPMTEAVGLALHSQKLMFAAASNDGANFGRAFPAKYTGVFCIHSTDGNGNPSSFNPTADDKDVNFSLLGEHVRSHWPAGKGGHNDSVRVLSGTSVATPIAAGLAAMILSFVRQQDNGLNADSDKLGPWLKDSHAMDAVLQSMVRQRRGSSRESIYNKIKELKKHMYR